MRTSSAWFSTLQISNQLVHHFQWAHARFWCSIKNFVQCLHYLYKKRQLGFFSPGFSPYNLSVSPALISRWGATEIRWLTGQVSQDCVVDELSHCLITITTCRPMSRHVQTSYIILVIFLSVIACTVWPTINLSTINISYVSYQWCLMNISTICCYGYSVANIFNMLYACR